MQSKTSSFNKEILLQVVRSVGWVSIVYFLGLCIALPIRMMMTYSRKQFVNVQVDSLFQYDYHIQVVLLVVIPIIMAVFLFRFLHVKQAADLIHSLPVKRSKIYQYYVLTGLVLLIVPVLLNTILILLTHGALDLSPYFGVKDILYWTVTTILMNIVLFLSGVFIAMMTGISAVQAVLTYVFYFSQLG
ncbi:hypothetical protein [Bacillus sp. T3]|uniref:hypothetical protein n=1 Tax=Bacillus sp. T3 TaxID=467262 RepID=UPI0029810E3B|nr:hypothetical protein [Bacillus sp. T3]